MSLIQHVSSVEGVDLEPLEDFGHVLERQQSHHTLSYDPIPSGPEGPLEKLEALAAYEVSQPKRIGESFVPSCHSFVVPSSTLTSTSMSMTDLLSSSDHCGSHHLCHGFRNRVRLRCSQDYPGRRGCLSRNMHRRRAQSRRPVVLCPRPGVSSRPRLATPNTSTDTTKPRQAQPHFCHRLRHHQCLGSSGRRHP